MLGSSLDASKAFDLVNHDLLFQKLIDRELPSPVVRFLSSWYHDQQMRVRWEHSYSDSFFVIHFLCLMVSGKAVCSLPFCFLYTWMGCSMR